MDKKPSPIDYLNSIYQYVCLAVQQDKTIYYPKNIVKVEQCFQVLTKYIQDKEKVDYDKANVDKIVEEGKK